MKRGWGLLIVVIALFSGCEQLSETYNIKDLGELDIFEQYLSDKNLIITEFLSGSKDKTGSFASYTFVFTPTGSINSVLDGDTIAGLWSAVLEDSIPKMLIDFGHVDEPLSNLNKEWFVLSQAEQKVELKDFNGEGDVNFVTFEQK
jgi:hypothetical protein